jgi:hypothetical protein
LESAYKLGSPSPFGGEGARTRNILEKALGSERERRARALFSLLWRVKVLLVSVARFSYWLLMAEFIHMQVPGKHTAPLGPASQPGTLPH